MVTDAGLAQLTALPHLRRLDLSGTTVTDEGMEHVAALTGLEALDLAWTPVSDTGLKKLAALKNLHELDPPDTSTEAGLTELKQSLPGCKIWK
jgi:hypothetical protein